MCVNLYFTFDVISNEKLVLNISLVITKTCSVFIALNRYAASESLSEIGFMRCLRATLLPGKSSPHKAARQRVS